MIHFLFLLFLLTSNIFAGPASIPENTLIQDDEIESWLQEVIENCFKVMHVPSKPKIYVINSKQFNAMATYGGVIFVNTQTIVECDNPEQLLGILLHETAHIAGRHLARMEVAMERSTLPMIASTILGGAATLATGNPAPLIVGAAGGGQIAERGMAKHTRSEETNADAAAARAMGRDAKYLVEILQKLESKMSAIGIDPYMLSHPLTQDRMSATRLAAQQNGEPQIKLTESLKNRFYWIQQKIKAYTFDKDQLETTYAHAKDGCEQYGAAIAQYRLNKHDAAVASLKKLYEANASQLYILALIGQIHLETDNLKEALVWLNKAHTKLPRAPGVQMMLAVAILRGHKYTTLKDPYQKVIQLLTFYLDSDRHNAMAWHLLGDAYNKKNDAQSVAACQAQVSYLRGDYDRARNMAVKGSQSSDVSLARQSKDLLIELDNPKEH